MKKLVQTAFFSLAALLITVPSHAAKALDDGQIAKIMDTADEGEVDAAKTVKRRLQVQDVKNYASMMIDDHKSNEKDIKDLAKKQKLSMSSGSETKQLKEDTKKTILDLKRQKDADLDKAYIQSQIDMHQALLNKIDSELMPAVTNAALKTYMTDTRAKVEAHLDRAREIQKSL